jgi:hypothetical protein
LPLPDLSEEGLLPHGLHDASFDEIETVFGGGLQRRSLLQQLRTYAAELRSAGFGAEMIIDGSFVTSKLAPNDIDLVVVLASPLPPQVRPFEYNLLSRRRVMRRFGIDLLLARSGSSELEEYVAFLEQVRDRPELTKGLVRVQL